MKYNKVIAFFILLSINMIVKGQQQLQQSVSWEKWNYLKGEWVGEGNGQPGKGEGKFSFQTDLNGKIMVRKNHTVFPSTEKSKEFVHDDLLIIYQASDGKSQEAIYFDNEGNTIKYKIGFADNAIILTSETVANSPRFRLTYSSLDSNTVKITFEMAPPDSPDKFRMYLTGNALKTK
jgi:hypothetical protein